jgi:hypothetical protein
MRRLALAALLVAAVIAASASAASTPAPGIVTLDGIGGVIPGMTAEQVATTWGIPVSVTSTLCTIVSIHPGNARGHALFHDGKLGAVFFDYGVHTLSGIGIGTTVTGLERIFGRNLQSADGSHFFFLTRHSSPHWQIRFDANSANRVVQIGFGEIGSVHVVAGCI